MTIMKRCNLCGHTGQADLYERTPGDWRCRANTGCEQRQLIPDLAPVTEDYPELGEPRLTGFLRARASEPGAL